MLLDLSPLRRRDYRLLYAGQTVSFVGSMLTYVAVPYQLYALTKSALLVGLLGTAQLVPLLLFGLWGGAAADTLDRRKVLVASEVVLAVASLAMLGNALFPRPSAVVIFVVAALASGVNGFHRPALEAMTPRLVPKAEMPAIAALGSLKYNIGAIGGPALAGFLIAKLGLAATYAIDAATFMVSIACLLALRAPAAPPKREGSPVAQIAEGLRYALARPELVGTYVVDIVAMTFAMPMALFPMMSERWGGASAAGWLYSAMAIGSLVMTAVSGAAKHVRRHGAAVIAAAAAWGVAIVLLGFAPSLPLAVLCLALAGAADMVSGLFRMTIWNQTIPDHFRGRLAAVEMLSYMTGPLLGNARAGAMAASYGERVSIVSGGVLCIFCVLACVPLLPAFWRYVSDVSEGA